MKIILNANDYEKIISRSKTDLPNEFCGLIAGVDEDSTRKIKKIYMLTNLDKSPEHFLLDPREQHRQGRQTKI